MVSTPWAGGEDTGTIGSSHPHCLPNLNPLFGGLGLDQNLFLPPAPARDFSANLRDSENRSYLVNDYKQAMIPNGLIEGGEKPYH